METCFQMLKGLRTGLLMGELAEGKLGRVPGEHRPQETYWRDGLVQNQCADNLVVT